MKGFLLVSILFIVFYGISWIITCGLIKLICMCFGLAFSWAIATGIWLILCLLKLIFGGSGSNKK